MAEEGRKLPRRSPRWDDHEWEDVQDSDDDVKHRVDSPEPSASATFRASRSSPRKRRTVTRPQLVSSSPRKSTTAARLKQPPSTLQRKPNRPLVTEEELNNAFVEGVRTVAIYAYDIGSVFFRWLKKPFALLLVVWVMAVILSTVSDRLRRTFAPLCNIPGISRTSLCYTKPHTPSDDDAPLRHADYPKMVEIQSKTFEQLLDESVGSTGLALEIKKAQMATSDLVTLVKFSKLTSKELLATALSDFVDDARQTARGLQKLSAKVSGAVDDILAVNDYALRTIEASSANQSQNSIMRIVWPFRASPSSNSQELLTTFSQSLAILSSSLSRLVISAQSSLHSLDKLESQLSTIHDILAREDATITEQQSELLAELWTRLGGNRAQMRGFEGNLQLLKELGTYRTRALAHVVAALQALEALSADMEELRERVATPEISGGEIPLEVHVRSIRSGIERLSEGRLKAKEREADVVRVLGVD